MLVVKQLFNIYFSKNVTGSNYPKQYFQTEVKNETIDSDTYF